jgi:uncharacterized UPF0160 family protein
MPSQSSFLNRLSLPEPWRGIRDEQVCLCPSGRPTALISRQLSALSGIPDCIFVHTSGFIGGNKTKVW